MRPHVHTDFTAFVFAGISAIVFAKMLEFAAAKLADYDSTKGAAKVIGSLITVGNSR